MYRHWDNQKKNLIELINKSQCVTCNVVYGTNYSIFFRNIHSDLLLKKTLVPVYIDLNNLSEFSVKGFFNLVLNSLKRSLVEKRVTGKMEFENLSQEEIIEKIKFNLKDLTSKSFIVTFFIEDSDILLNYPLEILAFFEEIKRNHEKCSFVYILKNNIKHPSLFSRLSKIPHLYENSLFIPIRDEKSLRSLERGMTSKTFDSIYSLTGGVDKFHGIAVDLKNNLSPKKRKDLASYIADNWNLRHEISMLWKTFSPSQVELMTKIVWGQKDFSGLECELNHLLSLNVIQKYGSGYKFTIGMLKEVGIEKVSKSNVDVKLARNNVIVNGNRVHLNLSGAEKKILRQLLANKNKIVARSAIAKSIWNGTTSKKYDESKIDTTVDQLKNKLSSIWVSPQNLVSVKYKGFIYQDAN